MDQSNVIDSAAAGNKAGKMAGIVYFAYLVQIPCTLGIAIVGVIIAYLKRRHAPEWLRSHYRFQIRTFWIGLPFVLLAFILLAIGGDPGDQDTGGGGISALAFLIGLLWFVWVVVRCVKGLKRLRLNQAYPNPASWLF